MATAVPMKGSTGRFSVDKVLEFMDEVGDQAVEVIVKSDQETAIVNGLVDEVVEAREAGRTIKEESPKYSKGSYWGGREGCPRSGGTDASHCTGF